MPPALATHAPNAALRRPAPARDGLSPSQRRAVVVAIAAAHVAGVWAVLQVPAVRESLAEAAPLFVNLLAPPAPPAAAPAPRPPVMQPLPRRPTRELITAAPAPAPESPAFVAPAPEPPPPLPAVVAEAAVAPPAPPAHALPALPPPAQIPASEVQYLVRPAPEYPRLSVRLGEEGRVLVRVYIDEAGLPRMVQVVESSGHARLDEAAVLAVQKARFKPYTRNGVATAGWARIPIPFELER